ncbi:PREDICTED: protein spinster homolog 3-like [Thamnophis sirtalis]|uniref:Protein spinster homolog 3-like n=1 Tax=Thamnophis sirtalis TaxID=35019 RepID=A0A6I9XR92_9SAUR|nr:PREDICTED: protein spinster homolog 3-like [Thamnophis sirtalis]
MAEGGIPDLPPQSPASIKAYGTMESAEQPQGSSQRPTRRAYIAIVTLCHLNLVNYMDWFLVAVFILCFLFSAPVFGYLGDRYNQKITLSIGISLWSAATFCSSFIPASMPWLFFISRGLVGAGTSSFSTIAPTIIADLFEKDYRTWMLSVFYIFIPVGSGLGYILSSGVTRASGFWGWGFRDVGSPKQNSFLQLTDGGSLSMPMAPNWSFVGSSLGVTCMGFITGALGFWMPLFLYRAEVVLGIRQPCSKEPCESHNSLPKYDMPLCSLDIFIALAGFFLSLNWAIVTDILLYVVKPACQSTALSLQIFMSHLLGDAGSPYFIGIIANTIKRHQGDDSSFWNFQSLKYSFVICIFIGVIGGGCFLLTAVHIEEDSKKAAAPATPAPVTPVQDSHGTMQR